MTSPLVAWLQAPDAEGLEALLSDAVRFHSPVTDYQGRADVAHLLGLISGVVSDVRPTRELGDGATTITCISGLVGDLPVQGVVDERYDEHGRLIDLTLMLRPLSALRVAVAAMATALAAAPLPSAR
jgi:hypothetical protein